MLQFVHIDPNLFFRGARMFGQQNDHDDNQQIPDQSIDAALQDTGTDAQAPVEQPEATAPNPAPQDAAANWQHPGMPLDPEKAAAVAAPAVAAPNYASGHEETSYTANDLIDIKQKALQELSPLVGHLDQSPEEKFRTTMMMIQASDDQTLVKDAYESASKIEDEKIRAQALLDIVNEINYFTTQHHDA